MLQAQSSVNPDGPGGRPLSIRAFSEAAETSPRRVRRLIRQGRLRVVENGGGEVRIPQAELDRMMHWRERRTLRRSMELSLASMEAYSERPTLSQNAVVSPTAPAEENYGAIPLPRHEAAMMRVGYLESELASTRRMLAEGKEREEIYRGDVELEKGRALLAESRLEEIQDKLVETEFKLEEMRSQVIESSFVAVGLQEEVKELRNRLMSSWFSRLLEGLRGRK